MKVLCEKVTKQDFETAKEFLNLINDLKKDGDFTDFRLMDDDGLMSVEDSRIVYAITHARLKGLINAT